MHITKMVWSLAGLVLLTGSAMTDEKEPAKLTPEEAIKTWKAAGGMFGHFRREATGLDWWFVQESQVRAGDLPIFLFHPFTAEAAAKLPVPPMPFGLYLTNEKTTDAGVKELARFENLHAIRLDGTGITDVGMKHLAGLKNLHTLNLSNTAITDAGLEHLAGLTNLQTLALSNTKITDKGMLTLKKLKKLSVLYINSTEVTENGIKELAGLKFKELMVPQKALTASGFKHYWAIIEPQPITQIQMWPLNDECMKELRNARGIERLHLASKDITDESMKEVATIKGLQYLYLYGTSVTDRGLAHLAGMNLVMLMPPDQAGTDLGVKNYLAARRPWPILYLHEFKGLTDEGLKEVKNLKGLEELHLSGDHKITDKGLAVLAGMNLKSLYLPNKVMTDEGLKNYLAALAPTDTLSLGFWNFGDEGLKAVAQIKGLRVLNLNNTKITDEQLKIIGGMKDLKELRLSATPVTGKGMEALKGLEKLETLHLFRTQVGDDGMKALGSIKSLQTLYLGHGIVTDKGLEDLTGLENLKSLNVYNTKVTPEGVKKLQMALSKCKILK